ncbi:hypothetical protein SNE98_000669 [Vibrio cholerae]|uniref:hypothetical protein n=1 Tax=Vibrio cholerae TaxID=666 RepID=UPI0018F0E6CD|nr:hypothetical protein [Vibrio cholerae]EID0160924.1 hypothetical protein [Vibrio cholerae]EJL6350295.1 hypothetical protein [Vibrio cholerae]ELY5213705.1 hypothetical protein [Vibrio cholerae]MBJ7016495.1 hypothetical protein [Vibrio cholerae]
MKKLTTIALAALCVKSAFASGPFGLEMGVPVSSIDKDAKQLAPYVYLTTNVPSPHSAFEKYVVKVAPTSGLCWVKAIGKDISTSSYGFELKSAFSEMNEKLTKKYGKGETTDLLMAGSVWNEPNDFMMAMLKKERFLMAVWEKSKGSNFQDNLVQVALIANPSNRDKGYITLEYSFSNKDACNQEIDSLEDNAL